MRLVDDDRVVRRQPAVGLDLRQQDAVGHELDRGCRRRPLSLKRTWKPTAPPSWHLQFLRHAPRHRARGDAARLGAADHAGARRGRRPGTASAAAWSCPSRFRRRSPRPGARGSAATIRRLRARSAAPRRRSAARQRRARASRCATDAPAPARRLLAQRRRRRLARSTATTGPCRRPRSRVNAPSMARRACRQTRGCGVDSARGSIDAAGKTFRLHTRTLLLSPHPTLQESAMAKNKSQQVQEQARPRSARLARRRRPIGRPPRRRRPASISGSATAIARRSPTACRASSPTASRCT